MNDEKILNAMSYIDEILIEETEKARSKKGRKLPFSKFSLVAACLALVLISTALALPTYRYVSSGTDLSLGEGSAAKPEGTPDKEDPITGGELQSQENISIPGGKLEEDDAHDVTVESTALVPMRLTITGFVDGGFTCTITENGQNDAFSGGDSITVIYADGAEIPRGLSEGDTVFVTYSLIDGTNEKIYAHKIYYTEGETTPAFYGGKQ